MNSEVQQLLFVRFQAVLLLRVNQFKEDGTLVVDPEVFLDQQAESFCLNLCRVAQETFESYEFSPPVNRNCGAAALVLTDFDDTRIPHRPEERGAVVTVSILGRQDTAAFEIARIAAWAMYQFLEMHPHVRIIESSQRN